MKTLVGAAVIALLAAPVAHADDNDDLFIAVLDMNNVPYSTRANVIASGHVVCKLLRAGLTTDSVGHFVETNTGWTPGQAGHMIGAAIGAYCPQYDPKYQDCG